MSTTFGDNHPNQTESKNLQQTNHLSQYTLAHLSCFNDEVRPTSVILPAYKICGKSQHGEKDLPLLSVCHQAVVLP